MGRSGTVCSILHAPCSSKGRPTERATHILPQSLLRVRQLKGQEKSPPLERVRRQKGQHTHTQLASRKPLLRRVRQKQG